jgi:hypothetical protein
MRRPLATCVAFLALIGMSTASGSAAAGSTVYSMAATKTCLRAAGAVITRVHRTDRRRIAVSDVAQRTSFEARLRGASVILAFARGESEAAIVRELLSAPQNPYLLRLKTNVVLMYRPAAARAAAAAIRCLRSG